MKIFSKIFFTMFLLACFSEGYSSNSMVIDSYSYEEPQTLTLENTASSTTLIVNGATYFQLKDLPKTGFLEIYSIIGRRMVSINLKDNAGNDIYVELPSGLYFVKSAKVSMKIVVK